MGVATFQRAKLRREKAAGEKPLAAPIMEAIPNGKSTDQETSNEDAPQVNADEGQNGQGLLKLCSKCGRDFTGKAGLYGHEKYCKG